MAPRPLTPDPRPPFHALSRRSSNSGQSGRWRQRLPGLPPGEVCPARRAERRRWRARRRRRHGRHRAPEHPAPIPLQSRTPRRARTPRRRQQPHRRRGPLHRSGGAGRHGGVRRSHRRAALRFHRAGPELCGGAAAGAAAAATRASPRPRTRRPPSTSRDARRRETPAPGVEAAGRCGAGGIPERRQIHADFAHLGGAAEDRRLPVHHARAEPGRGADAGELPQLRGGRYSRADRRRARRRTAWASSFCATSSARACWRTWWTSPKPAAATRCTISKS